MKTNRFRFLATAAMGCVALLGSSGCIVTGRDFRSVATPELQTGVKALLNGVLDGLFAAMAGDNSTGTNGTTSTSGH